MDKKNRSIYMIVQTNSVLASSPEVPLEGFVIYQGVYELEHNTIDHLGVGASSWVKSERKSGDGIL